MRYPCSADRVLDGPASGEKGSKVGPSVLQSSHANALSQIGISAMALMEFTLTNFAGGRLVLHGGGAGGRLCVFHYRAVERRCALDSSFDLRFRGTSLERNRPPPHDPPTTLGIGSRKDPRGMHFLMSEVRGGGKTTIPQVARGSNLTPKRS